VTEFVAKYARDQPVYSTVLYSTVQYSTVIRFVVSVQYTVSAVSMKSSHLGTGLYEPVPNNNNNNNQQQQIQKIV
jgi:hypothetical protein